MFKRLQWNKGICKKTGQPWVFLRYYGFRGPSIASLDRVYTDGLGNFIYIDTFSKINKEYEAMRTPQIKEKEQFFQQRESAEMEERKLHARNKTGPYAPTQWDKLCDFLSKPFSYLFYGFGTLAACWFLLKWISSLFGV